MKHLMSDRVFIIWILYIKVHAWTKVALLEEIFVNVVMIGDFHYFAEIRENFEALIYVFESNLD